jgi:hypothetical protein
MKAARSPWRVRGVTLVELLVHWSAMFLNLGLVKGLSNWMFVRDRLWAHARTVAY